LNKVLEQANVKQGGNLATFNNRFWP